MSKEKSADGARKPPLWNSSNTLQTEQEKSGGNTLADNADEEKNDTSNFQNGIAGY